MPTSKYEKEKESLLQAKEKEASGLDYSALSIDLVPQYLTSLEREIMIPALSLVANISPKYFEKIIQYAYIFDAVENRFLPLLDQGYTLKDPRVDKLSAFVIDFREYQKLQKKDPQKAKEFAFKLRIRYFAADDKTSSEKKRLALVTEINKAYKNYIPYHIKINHVLAILEAKGLLQHKIIGKKTLWNVEPHFYQRWLDRHKQLAEEKEQKTKEEATGDIKAREEKAMINMFEKYGGIILEFFLIDYWDVLNIKPNTLVLRYSKEISDLAIL